MRIIVALLLLANLTLFILTLLPGDSGEGSRMQQGAAGENQAC
jgi:hypothetical protein